MKSQFLQGFLTVAFMGSQGFLRNTKDFMRISWGFQGISGNYGALQDVRISLYMLLRMEEFRQGAKKTSSAAKESHKDSKKVAES